MNEKNEERRTLISAMRLLDEKRCKLDELIDLSKTIIDKLNQEESVHLEDDSKKEEMKDCETIVDSLYTIASKIDKKIIYIKENLIKSTHVID